MKFLIFPTLERLAVSFSSNSTAQASDPKFIIVRAIMCSDFCAMIFWLILAHLTLMKKKTQKDYSQDVDDYIYNNPGPELYSFEIWAL